MNKIIQTDQLLKGYYKEGQYIIDGIINEELYDVTKKDGKAILFIGKEVNYKGGGTWKLRDWWNEGVSKNFGLRLGEWAYGLLKGFPEYSLAYDYRKEAIKSIAFININKKIDGGSSTNDTKIANLLKTNTGLKEMLLKQIDILNPDIIIGCGIKKIIWGRLFGIDQWLDTGYVKEVSCWKSSRIINFYHPSNRFPSVMNYCLLEKITKSKTFINL